MRSRSSRAKKRRWDLETLVCSRRGHITPAAVVARLRPEDLGLGVDLPDGRRLSRCTRCDAWISGVPPVEPAAETLPPLAELPVPRRGDELREALVLRVISVDRAIHSVIFGLLAIVLFVVQVDFGKITTDARAMANSLRELLMQTGQGPSSSFLVRLLGEIGGLDKHLLLILLVTALVYCVVEGVEAVGLWLERRWAEYLTALATAGFLPFEVHELFVRVTVFRVGALAINVAILLWLLWRKRLFGLNGGQAGLAAERMQMDPTLGFAPPQGVRGALEGADRARRVTRAHILRAVSEPDAAALLAAYHSQLRPSPFDPMPEGVIVEIDGPLLRYTGFPKGGFVDYRDLAGLSDAEVDTLIARQVRVFAGRGESFEWKLHGYDHPADLAERLAAAGLIPEERETIVIARVSAIAASPVLHDGVTLREVSERWDLDDIAAMEHAVWNDDRGWLAESLELERAADPDAMTIVVAEAAGVIVCAAWVRFVRGTEFATLWGAATLAEWRRHGIYRAIVAYRANLAAERGFRYLQVDASDDSRPILERLGFVAVTSTTPYVWTPAST